MRYYMTGPYPNNNGVCARIADHVQTFSRTPGLMKPGPIGTKIFEEIPVGPIGDDGSPEFGYRTFLNLHRWPLPNVWLGIIAEDQKQADERIPHLLDTPAAVRIVRFDPLLGAVDLRAINPMGLRQGPFDALWHQRGIPYDGPVIGGPLDNRLRPDCITPNHVNWIIAGGESGHDTRPMHPDWVRGLRDQCKAADVSFFFDGWGEWTEPKEEKGNPMLDGASAIEVIEGFLITRRVGKAHAGRLLDGVEHNGIPKILEKVE